MKNLVGSAAATRRELLVGGGAAAAVALAGSALPGRVAAKAPLAKAQAPAFYRIKVGDIEVTALLDGHLAFPQEQLVGMFAKSTPEAVKDLSEKSFVAASGPKLPVNAYLVNTGNKLILIDSGASTSFGPTLGKLPETLRAAGIAGSDVDQLLLTHAHPDHIAGIADVTGGAFFPNAEVVLADVEYKFWADGANRSRVPEGQRGFFDVVAASLKPYSARLKPLTGEAEASAGVDAVALPGHTPGHIGYRISSGREQMLIWGDVMHVAAWQFEKPEWSIAFDLDQEQSAATRKRVLDMAASDRLLIAGMHLPFPGIGHVAREGAGYRYVPAPWQPL